jgi:hypothetical protein
MNTREHLPRVYIRERVRANDRTTIEDVAELSVDETTGFVVLKAKAAIVNALLAAAAAAAAADGSDEQERLRVLVEKYIGPFPIASTEDILDDLTLIANCEVHKERTVTSRVKYGKPYKGLPVGRRCWARFVAKRLLVKTFIAAEIGGPFSGPQDYLAIKEYCAAIQDIVRYRRLPLYPVDWPTSWQNTLRIRFASEDEIKTDRAGPDLVAVFEVIANDVILMRVRILQRYVEDTLEFEGDLEEDDEQNQEDQIFEAGDCDKPFEFLFERHEDDEDDEDDDEDDDAEDTAATSTPLDVYEKTSGCSPRATFSNPLFFEANGKVLLRRLVRYHLRVLPFTGPTVYPCFPAVKRNTCVPLIRPTPFNHADHRRPKLFLQAKD